jgi:hypothetical protein
MTGVWKVMFRRAINSLLAPLLACAAMAAPETREAPNPAASPANQLCVAGNACGPAALLNAFRFGNPDWQRASNAIAGANDRERMLRIIREIGMRPSKHVPGHPRWSRRGVSVADLRDMADEMIAGHFLPPVNEEVFFLTPRESPEKLLRRVHQRLETSLAKGLPPVISLRRYALRQSSGKPPQWTVIDAHFVTLTAIPRQLDKQARSFPVSYIDPWGGKRCAGEIGVPDKPLMADTSGNTSCLEADFPQTGVGKTSIRKGEETMLSVSAAIGRW